jgi:hypothetical protein
VESKGFRFGKLLDYRDEMFLPGGAKYLDLPGLLALSAPNPLWVSGEGKEPEIVNAVYAAMAQSRELTAVTDETSERNTSVVAWLLQ